jgi:hypothetical protein
MYFSAGATVRMHAYIMRAFFIHLAAWWIRSVGKHGQRCGAHAQSKPTRYAHALHTHMLRHKSVYRAHVRRMASEPSRTQQAGYDVVHRAGSFVCNSLTYTCGK